MVEQGKAGSDPSEDELSKDPKREHEPTRNRSDNDELPDVGRIFELLDPEAQEYLLRLAEHLLERQRRSADMPGRG